MNAPVKNLTAAAEDIDTMPLADINPGDPVRFQNDTIWPMFDRLRREDPVHFTPDSEYGPYWSVTNWADIMAVDTNHHEFSSADGITLINLKNRTACLRRWAASVRAGPGSSRWTNRNTASTARP